MKNKYVSIRDVLIFILCIITALLFWIALITIKRIFGILFKLCFTVFILFVVIKSVQWLIKNKSK